MRNGKTALQGLLCFMLIFSLILPVPGCESTQAKDDGLLMHSMIDVLSKPSELTLNSQQGEVTPMVAAGREHTVGLRSDGTVVATGDNTHGQCDVDDWTEIVQVAAGIYHTVGLRADGSVMAVGPSSGSSYDYGQCGVHDWVDIIQVAAGGLNTLGLRSDGTVLATGNNEWQQCDVGEWTGITQIATGGGFEWYGPGIEGGFYPVGHTVGLKSDGTVVAVGNNDSQQLNVDDWTDIVQVSAGFYHTVGVRSDGTAVVSPSGHGGVDVSEWTSIVQVSAGTGCAFGLRSDGTVVAAGRDYFGLLDVGGWTDVVQVTAGCTHVVGLRSEGTVVATGLTYVGQRGVEHWTDIARVSVGQQHTVAPKSDGTVVATGYNHQGQCDVDGWADITAVAAGHQHTVGIKSGGTMVAVGSNSYGQCDVTGWTNIRQVAASGYHTVGLKHDGTVVAVGRNGDGQCNIEEWTDIVQVDTAFSHTVGLKGDGTVVAAGSNNRGQSNVEGWIDIIQLAASHGRTVGLKSDGTVVAVGYNIRGECNVDGWADIVQVASGIRHTAGLKADGTVVVVGHTDFGQDSVVDWTGIQQVAAGYFYTAGVKADGTVIAASAEVELAKWNLGETTPPATQIWDWYDLDAVRSNLSGSYVLMRDLDTTTAGYAELAGPEANDGKGWKPIGTSYDGFAGHFDGRGYEIKNIHVDRPVEHSIGVFGRVLSNGVIVNLGAALASITGSQRVGGLVGANSGIVSNCHTRNTVTGTWGVGGLVGLNAGTVSHSYSAGSVSGGNNVGGLVGRNYRAIGDSATVSESHSSASVTGDNYVGGLIGYNHGTILGGDSTVTKSYATGIVSGGGAVGGLVGANSYGIVGDSFWDMDTSKRSTSARGTGKTTAEMMNIATFTDISTQGLDEPWDIVAVSELGQRDLDYTWNIVDGQTYPFLSWEGPAPDVPRFLTLPIADPDIRIQQGWRYTAPIGPNPDDPYAHKGIDYIKGVINEPATWQSFDVLAAADGVAMWSSGGGYGDFVLIRHDETDPQDRSYFTLYGHLADIEDSIAHRVDRFATDYESWTPVTRGQKIGEAGDTGSPDLIHLHFEVQRGGYAQNKVDPYDIYSTREYYPGGPAHTGCGPNSLWVASVCPVKPDRDDARYVADVTIPDGTTVQPGEGFVKTWQVRNTGTTTWSTDYRLVFDGGDLMDAPQHVNLEAPVPPNATVDMSVSMTAPLSGGAKRGYWRMENPAGLRFGQTVWVEIYVPHAPAPELQEAIDNLYNTTIQNLEYLKEAMETTAEHGDFFRRQVTTEQAALAVTLVSGFVSMGADVLDSIEHAKYALRLTHPGMDIASGGRWHELHSYGVGKHLFSAHQWQHLWATSPQAFSLEILNNNWMSYASMIGGTARDELAPNEALNLMLDVADYEDCFSGQVYPHIVSAIDMAKQHLTETRSETLSSLPSLSPEEQAAYAADLNLRATAAKYFYQSSTYTVDSLGMIRGFYETDPLTRGALAVLKFAARALAKAAFDGPGKLLVDGFLTAFDSYTHRFRLNESQQMVALAEGLLESGMRTSIQLHLNAFSGLRQVEDSIAPQTVTGSIGSISHWSQGHNPSWDPFTTWKESASYSIVEVTNDSTGSDSATFRIVATYPADYRAIWGFGSMIPEVAEAEVIEVSPGETVYVRLDYNDEFKDNSPARGGQMHIWLLGSSDSGTFAIDLVGTRWEPHLAPHVTGQVMPSLAVAEDGEEIEIIDNPVSVFLSASTEDLIYEVQTWVVNPVVQNVTAIIQHDLCDDWQVLSAPGAHSSNSTQLIWEVGLQEGDLAGVTFTFAYNGDLSLDIVVPCPVVILETADGEFLGELMGNSRSLRPMLPVAGSVTMPVQILPGDQAPVSVALQNLSTETIDGDVIISVTNPTGSSAYNETQSFSLAASANATLDYLLPAFPEKGPYRVLTDISHGGVTRVLGRDVLRVGTFALAASLNATPADRVHPGDTIVYCVSLNNTSGFTLNNITVQAAVPNETLAHDISDDGQLDGSVVEWQLPDPVFPGGTVELWFQATVLPDVIGPDQARNIKSSVTAASDEALHVGSNEVRILLVANPVEVMGTIVGEVDLYGQMDNSGVLVTVNGTHIITTASDGGFSIDVPEGSHNVTFMYPGFNTVVGENVSVIAGEEVALPLVVLVPSTIVTGQTREVNCGMLGEATVCLYHDQVLVDCAVSDGDGVFTLAVPGFGDYQLVVSKDGFRDEMRAISVTEPITHTVGFDGDHGLIPNAPNMSYVLECINLWQFGEPQCKLSMSRVLAVINAWQFPVLEDDGG